MIFRYSRIREFWPELGSMEIDEVVLTASELHKFVALMIKLKSIESVTKALQGEENYISDVRFFIDPAITLFPVKASLISRLS